MCGPRVIGAVKQEITRRQALGLLATPVVAGTLVGRAEARQAPVRLAGGFTRIHDLTHTLSPQTPVYPAFNPFQIVQRFEIASDGFYGSELTFGEHTGTHLDAPVHFAAGGLSPGLRSRSTLYDSCGSMESSREQAARGTGRHRPGLPGR